MKENPTVMSKKIFGWACGVVLVSSAAVFFAPEPPNLTLLSTAVQQQKILWDVEAENYAPPEFEAYAGAVERARAELAAQREKFYYSRQFLTFNRLSREAIEAGGAAERMALEKRQTLQRASREGSEKIAATLAEIRFRSARLGLSQTSRSRLVRAEVLLREAELLGQQDRWLEASERTEDAIGLVRAVEASQQERADRFSQSDLVHRWETHVRETIDWTIRQDGKAVIVDKSRHTCYLLDAGRVIRAYSADFGQNGVFDKSYRGDGATPEGKYKVTKKKGRGYSKFYKALLLNYPNEEDIREYRRARMRGLVTPRTGLGGLIEIHGDGGKDKNWTDGCVALANDDMDDLFERVGVGTPVTIVGRYAGFDRISRVP